MMFADRISSGYPSFMNRVRSITLDLISWLLAGAMLYLAAVRLAVEVPWAPRLIGLMLVVVLPFTFLRQVMAGFGIEIDLLWIALPLVLAGLIPLGSSR